MIEDNRLFLMYLVDSSHKLLLFHALATVMHSHTAAALCVVIYDAFVYSKLRAQSIYHAHVSTFKMRFSKYTTPNTIAISFTHSSVWLWALMFGSVYTA